MVNHEAFFQILGWNVVKVFLIFGVPYLIFWKINPEWATRYKIQKEPKSPELVFFEFKYTLLTTLIQSCFFFSFFILYQFQIIKFSNFFSFSNALAFMFYFLIYDAYFYFLHRFLHKRWFFKYIHFIHHKSINPTPWASYSFHPVEAFLNLLYLYPFLLLFDVHVGTFIVLLLLTDIGNLAGHLGFDFVPSAFMKNRFGQWLTTPTHHNIHHRSPKKIMVFIFAVGIFGWVRLIKKLMKNSKH